jgi:hypothetical protein
VLRGGQQPGLRTGSLVVVKNLLALTVLYHPFRLKGCSPSRQENICEDRGLAVLFISVSRVLRMLPGRGYSVNMSYGMSCSGPW